MLSILFSRKLSDYFGGTMTIIPSRTSIRRRDRYLASTPSEAYMAPLLREWIERQICLTGRTGGRALDVGCGEQPFRHAIVTAGMTYHSFDVTQNAMGSVDFVGSLDGQLPIELTSRPPYDLLLCTEVFEHVAEWARAFRNLNRLLAPGGTLIVTYPHVYPPHEEPHDYWKPTTNSLRHFAIASGLLEVCIERSGDKSGFVVV
jgi:2-polyprenyl-3-methyl-5-hydroxy-6-metoxy-1,4-benzoquinol methylase